MSARSLLGHFLTVVLAASAARDATAAPGRRQDPALTAEARQAPLVLARTIALPGVAGRIDHLALDLARQRLFVAARGNDSVEVVDLSAGKTLKSLAASEPQGILYLAGDDRLVFSNARTGTLDVHDGDTLARLARVEVGADADNLRHDPHAKRVYAACAEGLLVSVATEGWKVLARIPLAGHPESFQLDPGGQRAFLNVPDAHQLVLADLENHAVLRTWPVEEASANFPLAWVPGADSASPGLLLLGCRSPARLVLRSAANADPLGTLELSGDTDDLFHDARHERLYAICGAGSVDVFERVDATHFRALTKIPTAPGARTGLFVPERGELFVAVPHRDAQPAEIRVFTVAD